MNKNQITMAAIGGVALVATLVFAYLAWSASSESTELNEALEGSNGQLERLRSSKVAPNNATIKMIESNTTQVANWIFDSLVKIPGVDWEAKSDLQPAKFKQDVMNIVGKLRALPGSAEEGRLVAKNFNFGFDFITSDTMPDENKLVELSRQWHDVETLVNILAECGVETIESITVNDVKVEEKPQPQQNRRGNRKEQKVEDAKTKVKVEKYTLRFKAAQAPLVKAINSLASADNIFATVDTMEFARETDPLAALQQDGKGNKPAASASRSRGRRGRRGAQAEAETAETGEEDANKKGQVVNAASVAPFVVTLTVSTYYFETSGGEK